MSQLNPRQKQARDTTSDQHVPLISSSHTEDEYLPDGEEKEEDIEENQEYLALPRKRIAPTLAWTCVSFSIGVLLTLFITWSIGLFSVQPLKAPILGNIEQGMDEKTGQPAHWFNGPCGGSAEKARSLGCVFDIVSHSWLPETCLHREDIEDGKLMYANNTWHWGLDNLTEVSLDSVRLGEFDRVWTSMDWHVLHCTYIWKRLHRALLEPGRVLDSYTADYHHTKHCIGMIQGLDPQTPLNATGTRVYTKYPSCS